MHDSDTAKVYIIRKERRNEFVISLRGNIKMRSFSFFFLFPLADVRRRVSFDAWWVEIRRKNSAHEDATVFLWMKTSPSPKKEIASNIRNKRNCFFFGPKRGVVKKRRRRVVVVVVCFVIRGPFFFLVDLVCGWKRNRIDVRMNYWHNSPAGIFEWKFLLWREKTFARHLDGRSKVNLSAAKCIVEGRWGRLPKTYICMYIDDKYTHTSLVFYFCFSLRSFFLRRRSCCHRDVQADDHKLWNNYCYYY